MPPISDPCKSNVREDGPVLRTLLLTDLVDSTKLVEQLGDSRAFEVATRHDRVARDLLPLYQGREIDKTDGFLLLFERPHDAVAYALAYHRALAELSMELEVQLRARAGIHMGEVFLRENTPEDVAGGAKPLEVEGLAKPTAARAMSLAGGKQTLLTQGAFDLAREAVVDGSSGGKLRWLAHGPYLFKGVEEPVEIFEVGVEGQAPLTPPADTAKVRRAVAAGDEITLGWRPAPGLEIPRRSGWLLEKQLGEGGFGEVWLARQTSTGSSRVFKFCYDAERLRALQREVTLFRLLKESLGDREDILRIHDWNLDQAPYYLEAEYIEAGNLVEWADEQGGLAEVPILERLETLAQVADALAAAHSVGVLHKDVKPQNVLITTDREGRTRAKLTDFGIGEVVDQRELLAKGITVLGLTEMVTPDGASSIAGSHLYRAPEVSEGKPATVQADVYALGVMLYQVAVGDFQRALAPGWRRDVEDEILAEDIASLVDGAPERRPASAQEVASRLRSLEARRLERQAERRRREEAEAQRLALERAQRRRKVFTAIAAAATVFLAVVSVLAVQAIRAREVADQRRGQAESMIGFMLGDLRDKLEPLGRLEILDDVGDKALEYFAAVPEPELSDDELLSRSRALYQIGDVRIAQGSLDAALAALEESLALAKSLVARNPDDGQRLFELGQSHFWVGFVDWRRGKLDSAREQFTSYLDISRSLVALDPENSDYQLELAYAYSNLGSVEEAKGDLDEALRQFSDALTIKESLAAAEPGDPGRKLELARTYNSIGVVQEKSGNLAAARSRYEEELAVRRSLHRLNPSHTGWRYEQAISHHYLGAVLEALGEPDRALGHYEAAASGMEELVGLDPSNWQWGRQLAVELGRIAMVQRTLGELQPAAEAIERSVGILESLSARDPTDSEGRLDLGQSHNLRAATRLAAGDHRGAMADALEAIRILEPVYESNPTARRAVRFFGLSHLLLGQIRAGSGELEGAREAWGRAVEILQEIAATSFDRELLDPLARGLVYLGRLEEAQPIVARLRKMAYNDADFWRVWNTRAPASITNPSVVR